MRERRVDGARNRVAFLVFAILEWDTVLPPHVQIFWFFVAWVRDHERGPKWHMS